MKQRLRNLLESILGADRPTPRWLVVVVCLVVVLAGGWYAWRAQEHGRKNNTIVEYNDQRVYLHYALSMASNEPGFYTPRMRMPAYAWVLSHVAHSGMSDADLFPTAKTFNISLSLVCLVLLFFVLRRWLGGWIGLCFCLVAAFQLYVLRSAYVQPEIMLTTVVTVAWAWAVYTLHEPNWKKGVVCGLLLCLWFLTKASAQAALGLFLAVLGVKWLFAGRGNRLRYFLTGVAVVAAYVIPMTPYLYTSYKHFGSPFYNAQSKYYLWVEDVDDKHRMQQLNLDINLANLPADRSTLPSFQRYAAKHKGHVWKDIQARLWKGLDIMFKLAFMDYGLFYFFVAVFAGAAIWGAARAWPESAQAMWDWKWELLYIFGLGGAFVVLFGWFTPIKVGPRLIESVTLAPMFFCAAATHFFLKDKTETVWGMRLSAEKIFVVLFLGLWVWITVKQVGPDLQMGFFGG